MSSNTVYIDMHRSLLSYCDKFLGRNGITGFQVFDWDSHNTIEVLPDSHLIGISDYAITNEGKKYRIECMLAICTMTDDKDLKILRSVMAKLFNELQPGTTGELLPVLDVNGVKRGYLTVGEQVGATSIGSTDTRPLIGLMVSFGAGYIDLP